MPYKECEVCAESKWHNQYRKGETICKKCEVVNPSEEIEVKENSREKLDRLREKYGAAQLERILEWKTLAVNKYKPQAHQVDVFEEVMNGDSKIVFLSGAKQVGKTLMGAVCCVRKALAKPNQKIAIIANATARLGQVIYPALFEAGAFKLEDGTDAPELLPKSWREDSANEGIVWADKGSRAFKVIRLKNGSVIYGISASSKMQESIAGIKLDFVWQDECPEFSQGYLSEILSRLLSRGGRIFISASTTDISEEYLDLRIDLENLKRDDGKLFILSLMDREDLSDQERDEYIQSIPENERSAVIDGGILMRTGPVYPKWRDCMITWEEAMDRKHGLLDANGDFSKRVQFSIGLDPGTQAKFGIVLIAHHTQTGKHYMIDDSFSLPGMTPERVAIAICQLAKRYKFSYRSYYQIIFDPAGARQPTGNLKELLAAEFKKKGIKTKMSGHYPTPAHKTNRLGSIQKVRQMMEDKSFYVLEDCKGFKREVISYSWSHDSPEPKHKSKDVLDAMRYVLTRAPGQIKAERYVRKGAADLFILNSNEAKLGRARHTRGITLN